MATIPSKTTENSLHLIVKQIYFDAIIGRDEIVSE